MSSFFGNLVDIIIIIVVSLRIGVVVILVFDYCGGNIIFSVIIVVNESDI